MRNELNFWVVGGDMRQAKLAELLAADGHTVHAYALERLGALDGVEMKNLERLIAEVDWFAQKHDYRNADKPWGESRDSVERCMKKLRGEA